MRYLIVGLGSIGARHLANLRGLAPHAEIAVLRHTPGADCPSGADRAFYTLDEAIAFAPEAALICGPTAGHARIGTALARAGAHLFVEKPLALDAREGRDLVDVCAQHARIIAVGYNLRFLRSLRALRSVLQAGDIGRPMSLRAEVGQYLPDWRPAADYRTTASARAEYGGGAALELSHEFDYVRWLMGEVRDVRAFTGKLSDLDLDVEDTVEALLQFESGAIGSVHTDMAQRSTTRTCRIAGTEGTLLWDAVADSAAMFTPKSGWHALVFEPAAERNAGYVEELANFLAATRGEAEVVVSGADGLRTLEIVSAVKQSSVRGETVTLSKAFALR